MRPYVTQRGCGFRLRRGRFKLRAGQEWARGHLEPRKGLVGRHADPALRTGARPEAPRKAGGERWSNYSEGVGQARRRPLTRQAFRALSVTRAPRTFRAPAANGSGPAGPGLSARRREAALRKWRPRGHASGERVGRGGGLHATTTGSASSGCAPRAKTPCSQAAARSASRASGSRGSPPRGPRLPAALSAGHL